MAVTTKPLYGSNNQTITITVTSILNNGQQGSAAIDNTSILMDDLQVMVIVKTNGSGVSSTGFINIWLAGTANGGTNYSDGVTGTNAVQTLSSPPNVKLIGVINANAASTTYVGGPFPIAPFLGGVPSDHVAIVIENKTGATLDPTTGSAFYQGNQLQTA